MRMRGTTALIASAVVAAAALVAAPPAVAADPPRPIVSGWFGWWASDVTIAQMTSASEGVVGEVAMFWWTFQGPKNPLCPIDNGDYDGDTEWGDPLCKSPTPWTTSKSNRQRKLLQDAGIKVNASITDLSSGTANRLANYLRGVGKDGKANAEQARENRSAYAAQITEYAQKAKVDGIDLDWENFAFNDGKDTWAQTRKAWVAFIKVLSENLRAAGLTLWATVPGGSSPFVASWMTPTNECGDARGPVGGPNPGTGYCVYAWDEIAPYVDRLNIMAYDYSYSVPGPIGPNDWARSVTESAVQQVGADNATKVWIGAPQYGRDWPLRLDAGWVVNEKCPAGWKPVTTPERETPTPGEARAIADREKVEPTWNATPGEWSFDYWQLTPGRVDDKDRNCKIKRTVWFADAQSALARAKIVPDERIGGIAVWDFGSVQSDFYPTLLDYGRKIAPAATTVTVQAPKSARHGSAIPIRVATESRAGAAGDAEATLYFVADGGSTSRTEIATLSLDSAGKGTFRVPAQGSGSWVVGVAGSWSRHPGESEPVRTSVRFGVTAQASDATITSGTPVTISGTVSPGTAGLAVTVQRRIAKGEWRDVSAVTTGTGGALSVTVTPKAKGDAVYRLVVPAADGLEQGMSARIVITVA